MARSSKTRSARAACLLSIWLLAALLAGAALAQAIWPALGDKTSSRGGLTIDYSAASQGYIMAKAKANSALKLRISKDGKTYTYDLNRGGEYEVFPLQLGSGKYRCELYRNVKGNKYSKQGEISVSAKMEDENAAFLCPSQYVNYTPDSPAVAMAQELCAGLETDADKIRAVRAFMTKGFTYDYVRALTAPKGYLGDVDGCFETRMGLCQDLAAVAACMLRSQGIATQLVIGYAGEIYHAWNNVMVDGKYLRLDITADLSGMARDTVYSAERIY